MTTNATTTAVFDLATRDRFAALYPETAGALDHSLSQDARFGLDALADLAERLGPEKVEYNAADLPIGVRAEDVGPTGRSIGDTIREIERAGSWAVLKNVEADPVYARLLSDLLSELAAVIDGTTGRILRPQAYIFISSPGAITPFHFDPEHNILMQLRGSKDMHTFPAGDPAFAADREHERYHRGGHRNLPWDDALMEGATVTRLTPGKAVYVPVMAPHFVRNGPESSVSLSITWRSEWSMAEANARAFNGWLRDHGLSPKATQRFPNSNTAKAFAGRVLRKFG